LVSYVVGNRPPPVLDEVMLSYASEKVEQNPI
jgi:hypothetical protein